MFLVNLYASSVYAAELENIGVAVEKFTNQVREVVLKKEPARLAFITKLCRVSLSFLL